MHRAAAMAAAAAITGRLTDVRELGAAGQVTTDEGAGPGAGLSGSAGMGMKRP